MPSGSVCVLFGISPHLVREFLKAPVHTEHYMSSNISNSSKLVAKPDRHYFV